MEDLISKIRKAAESTNFCVFGVRALNDREVGANAGDQLDNSWHVVDDCEAEQVGGGISIGIDDIDEDDDIEWAIEALAQYPHGNGYALIGGMSSEDGWDDGEKIISGRDEVLMVWS